MQHNSMKLQTVAVSEELFADSLYSPQREVAVDAVVENSEPIWLRTQYEDSMELYADRHTVAQYLDHHQGWFRRCAEPMQTRLIDQNAYDLLIGRFGALGYAVEARVGLNLIPPDANGLYQISTVPVPGYTAPGYEVNFQSTMKLVERSVEEVIRTRRLKPTESPAVVTAAEWRLDLAVGIQFPKFVRSMSESLIQRTGEGLLDKIIKQVSRRLSHKTQLDFHNTLGIPFPHHRYR
ncbi:MAG: DUF1997 domain-containing protein [Oscillatoriales cyanobacterium RM2_1_1]|nr:DUF1997 domain-containing protein [Oscillatoriales cyanobacterium SM2_3_0]NJO45279.1 DUF1997 domain-containing protein [Oscillatoriales cyanobacterium RM2_1_1]